MKKKLLSILLVCLLITTFIVGCTSVESDTDTENDKKQELVVENETEKEEDEETEASTDAVGDTVEKEEETTTTTETPSNQTTSSNSGSSQTTTTQPSTTTTPDNSTGSSSGGASTTPSTPSQSPQDNTPSVTVPDQSETGTNLVWVPVNGGTKYHSKSSCSNMKEPMQVSKETAEQNGYTACKRCY